MTATLTTMDEVRTQVAIIGAGPAGMLLSHLLAAEGIESVVVETRTEEYVASRIRAGILEQSTVDLLRASGLGERLDAEGHQHRGIYLQWPGERHHLDFVDLTGRSVWVYGQTEVQKDLVAARAGRRSAGLLRGRRHRPARPEQRPTVGDLHRRRPGRRSRRGRGRDRRLRRLVRAVAGRRTGAGAPVVGAGLPVLVARHPGDVAPSTDELIYAWHPDGFALHSMRSDTVSRFYVQVPNDTPIEEWSDDRIWEALATRLGHGQDGWSLETGPVTSRAVLPMRSFVATPMRHGRLFLAGDAAHIVPPTGAKGLNLAVADVALLAPALAGLVRGSSELADAYSDTALRRVWRCTHFSWWMTSMLHTSGDPFDAELQLSQLRWVCSSDAGATGLAENYAGLPIGF